MTKGIKIGLIAGVILLMGLSVLLFSSGGKRKLTKDTFVSSNWVNKYGLLDKNPYGLYLFTTLTKAHIDSSKKYLIAHNKQVFDSLLTTKKQKTYFFVGNRFGLYSDEMIAILDRVKEGSDLFLAYNGITENLEQLLFENVEMQFDYAPQIQIQTKRKSYSMFYLFQNDTLARDWKFFGNSTCFKPHRSLSWSNDLDNLIEINHGKGKIILCSTPNVFYNYQLKTNDGYYYTQFVLNNIPKKQDVVYLELGRLSEDYDEAIEGNNGEDDSYLRLLFTNSALLKAMLLSLLGLLLFTIFRSKRIRPIVPYIDKKKDMTLAFAEVITSIYFNKRNPYILLQVQKRNFFAMIQKHFYLDLNRGDRANVLNSLSEKSNYSKKDLEEILELMETTTTSEVNEHYLAKVLGLQHEFYRKTGIISDKIIERTKKLKVTFRRSLLLPSLLILGGIMIIFIGLYFLMNSYGGGVVLWPIGIFMFVLGILRISKPYLIVEDNQWIVFSPFGKKTEFTTNDILEIELLNSGVVFHLHNQNKLIINYWELSRFDGNYFKRFIAQIQTEI